MLCVCVSVRWCVIVCYSGRQKTVSFIGWDAQTQTVVWPSVDQIAIEEESSWRFYFKLSFLHFEIGSVRDIGGFTGGISFKECRIKGSVKIYSFSATYNFVNCSWLPSLSLSNFSSNYLHVRGANLIIESSQLTGVYLYYNSSWVNGLTTVLLFVHEEVPDSIVFFPSTNHHLFFPIMLWPQPSSLSLKSSQVKSSTVIVIGIPYRYRKANTTIHSCVFSETTVSVEGYNVLISKCQFVNTSSANQAVLAITTHFNAGNYVVSDCVFEGNSGNADKGGILSFTSKPANMFAGIHSLTLYHNMFRHNTVAAKDQYGVINVAGAVNDLIVTDCQFDCNEHADGEVVHFYPPIHFDRLVSGKELYRNNSIGSCSLSVRAHLHSENSVKDKHINQT